MRPTSLDLRQRIIHARSHESQSMGHIAERFKIPKGTVQNIIEHQREYGSINPKPHNAGRKPAFSGSSLKWLESCILLRPDATLTELREKTNSKVSLVTIHNTLKKLGFTRKKKLYVRASNNEPTLSSNAKAGRKRSAR